MTDRVRELIARLAEVDQMAAEHPSSEQTIERALVRQQLATLSHHKPEQLYFLAEATGLLEMALLSGTESESYERLAAQLAAVYLQWYQVTREARYLTVVQQVLAPVAGSTLIGVRLGFARLYGARGEAALLRHWLTKLLRDPTVARETVLDAPEFESYRSEPWFQALIDQPASSALSQY